MRDNDPVPFLTALGLDTHADQRAVRRAYAQRVKQIDQAHQADEFQRLRTHYENALRWVAWQEQRHDEPDVPPEPSTQATPPAPAPPPEPTTQTASTANNSSGAATPPAAPPSPEAVAEAVFADFLATAHAGPGFADERQAREALDRMLADDRLVNLEARTLFEWHIARLLMAGWQPGHEYLFGPACAVFQWEQDRRHLELFGPLGASIDAAINEKLIFFRQPPHQFDTQRQLIRRLRDPKHPSPKALGQDIHKLESLVQRYPHWLQIITSRTNIIAWRTAWESQRPGKEASGGKFQFKPTPPFEPSKSSGTGSWFMVLLIMGALGTIGRLGSMDNRVDSSAPKRQQGNHELFRPQAPTMEWLQTRQKIVDTELRQATQDLAAEQARRVNRVPATKSSTKSTTQPAAPAAPAAPATTPATTPPTTQPTAPPPVTSQTEGPGLGTIKPPFPSVGTLAPVPPWEQPLSYDLLRSPEGAAPKSR